ncbi:hypothetical protein N7463_005385 [Penicillium fimorum]|uniref:Uncharacterized protein n=1 Tax=Penicillium fimorum TaxID=1882269 RepID=A0A9W9XTB4_9EURO|nr:hypothetical protein N7463_005385 [Penicillium fimorum]
MDYCKLHYYTTQAKVTSTTHQNPQFRANGIGQGAGSVGDQSGRNIKKVKGNDIHSAGETKGNIDEEEAAE